jgi:hypothetical protein
MFHPNFFDVIRAELYREFLNWIAKTVIEKGWYATAAGAIGTEQFF